MAKIMRLSLTLSFVSLFFLVTILRAEDYVSKDVPPDEVIMKAIETSQQRIPGATSLKVEKILGKRKMGDDVYTYYYTYSAGFKATGSATVEKLDTNVWILNGQRAIQK
jgi:predicted type IV restriction endonuclease